jgi:hypothetical protein
MNPNSNHNFSDGERNLFKSIADHVQANPNDYKEAGEWLDEYCNESAYWLQQEDKLEKLKKDRHRFPELIYQKQVDHLESEIKERRTPALIIRFQEARKFLLEKYQDQAFLSKEVATKIILITWLLTDADAEKAHLHITESEKWEWEPLDDVSQLSRGYAGFLFTQNKDAWMGLVRVGWDNMTTSRQGIVSKNTKKEQETRDGGDTYNIIDSHVSFGNKAQHAGRDVNTTTPEAKKEKGGWGWIKKISLILGIIVSLIAIFGPCNKYTRKDKSRNTSVLVRTSSIEPVIEINVDINKVLTLENKGPTDLEDICIFATRYVFDENCFGKEVKIKEYNRIGGSLYNIPILEAKIGRESLDLTKQSLIKLYKWPFGKDNYIPFTTFYCFRVTYRETGTGAKHADYFVTTSYTDFASPIENRETTASWGTPEGDFIYKIPTVIKDHQKTIFGE